MTVATNLNRKEYAGNGVTTAFSTSPFVFFEEDDLDVYVVVDATGVATLKTITTHYTVSGGAGSTGTVTMLTAPASGETLVIVRNLDIVQETDLVNNDGSDAEVLEDLADKIVMIAQQQDARIERSFRLPDSDVSGASTELPTPEAGTVIGWDDDALSLVNYTATDLDLSLASTYFASLVGVADAEELMQDLIDGIAAETSPAPDDLVVISDVSLAPDDARKMTLENMLKVVNGLTAEPLVDKTADSILFYDNSASAARRVLAQWLPLPRSYLAGCALSNNSGDATNDIDIAAGQCRDSTDAFNILCAAMTKRLDANWSAGTGNGLRNSAAAITDTTYHIYAVATAAGVQDYYAHTSTTVATVLTALQAETGGASYVYARRIASIIRSGSTILAFTQVGDDFLLTTGVQNSTTNPGTTDTAFTLTVPIGLRVKPFFHVNASGGTATMTMSIRTPDIGPTEAPASSGTSANQNWGISANGSTATRYSISQHDIYTNTSGQINIDLGVTAGTDFEVRTYGWRDRRGRDD